jgi:two-component system response regulator GlrR
MNDNHAYSLSGPDAGSGAAARPGQRPVVLVIDGDFRRRGDMSKMIAGHGYTVLTAKTGEEALALVARGGVVLVVSSLVMPRMDGLELLRVMRERQPFVPVVVIASGDKAIDQVYLRGADVLGAARTFTWPLLPPAFLDSIDSLIEQAS